jgi:hypothetical protein|tara:strand:+ start:71 stop:253 length:183 start_codon:yes stop_codon:yes gene_type:complete
MNWYAFDYGGQCFPLGNCGDYDVAEEIADDTIGDAWVFLMTAQDIINLALKVKEIDNGNG